MRFMSFPVLGGGIRDSDFFVRLALHLIHIHAFDPDQPRLVLALRGMELPDGVSGRHPGLQRVGLDRLGLAGAPALRWFAFAVLRHPGDALRLAVARPGRPVVVRPALLRALVALRPAADPHPRVLVPYFAGYRQ